MEGRNSHGRRVSLLNDAEQTAILSTSGCSGAGGKGSCDKSISRGDFSLLRSSSEHHRIASSNHRELPPALSLISISTPRLSRHDSSSTDDTTPSPLTPSPSIDPANFRALPIHTKMNHHGPTPDFSPGRDATYGLLQSSALPCVLSNSPPAPDTYFTPRKTMCDAPLAQQGFCSYLPPLQVRDNRSCPSPTMGTMPSTAAVPKLPSKGQKRTQFPCPLAREYNCHDHFTTSGHAARHAKRHTGKKDAICPECGKGFTRKDNMEQHRRTHQNGRATRTSSSPQQKSPQPSARSSPPQNQSEVKPPVQQLPVQPPLPLPVTQADTIPIDPLLTSTEYFSPQLAPQQLGAQQLYTLAPTITTPPGGQTYIQGQQYFPQPSTTYSYPPPPAVEELSSYGSMVAPDMNGLQTLAHVASNDGANYSYDGGSYGDTGLNGEVYHADPDQPQKKRRRG
ncbi:hypothetical protein EJ06DRAFT_529504 [Trichodelitschia bisporula]|uniref:C2H2-type domain-containing protein n=1 Tax=Trichodelitschia bisporula TaxID=703511 RepID=A0A6G1HZW0_9PEZI|nr:hypothetical protein EJ06DRAFT_529504 [Trichodelitschia bisporula]